MKNLKKVLAMVLVVAMVASFAVTASATSFTDDASINYTTAVEVLTGLGVINGRTDGAFHPTDDVTRGEFAKMAAYVLNGGVDAAPSYASSAVTAFSDVASTHYAAASIGYVVNKGLVDGFTDNTFRPDNSVTGVQAAKILLTALGYSSSIEGYTGSAWAQNVQNDAEEAGLFTGIEKIDLTANLTREEAAQMIWNALQATMVSYAVGGTTITTSDGTTISTGASAATKVVNVGADAFKGDGYVQLVEKCFSTLTAGTTSSDDLGRPTTVYTRGGKEIATVAVTPVATYTTTVTAAKLYTDLGLTATNDEVTTIENGADAQTIAGEGTGAEGVDEFATITKGDKDTTFGGNGILTEVYVVDGDITIVTIVPTVAQVTNVKTTAATTKVGAYTTYTIGETDYKVFSSVVDAEADVDGITLTGTVAKGDGVFVYHGAEGVYAVKAETVNGILSSIKSNGTYTIGGKGYQLAAYADAGDFAVVTTAADFYIDAYGYIVAPVTALATAPVHNYGLVVGADYSSALVNNKLTTTYTVSVATADGTVTDLTVAQATYNTAFESSDPTQDVKAQVVEYTLDSDTNLYTLVAAATPEGEGEVATVADVTGLSKGTVTLVDGTYANNATLFVIPNLNTKGKLDGTVKTVTGIANIGTYESAASVAIDLDGDTIADVVFVTTLGDETVTVTSLTYVTEEVEETTAGKTYTTIVDGAAGTVTIPASKTLTAHKLYESITVTGSTVTATEATAIDGVTTITYNGGLLKAGETVVSLAGTTPVYKIETTTDECDTVTLSDITSLTGTAIYFVGGATLDKATAIYVLYTAE
jgi:hypothetical protein